MNYADTVLVNQNGSTLQNRIHTLSGRRVLDVCSDSRLTLYLEEQPLPFRLILLEHSEQIKWDTVTPSSLVGCILDTTKLHRNYCELSFRHPNEPLRWAGSLTLHLNPWPYESKTMGELWIVSPNCDEIYGLKGKQND